MDKPGEEERRIELIIDGKPYFCDLAEMEAQRKWLEEREKEMWEWWFNGGWRLLK